MKFETVKNSLIRKGSTAKLKVEQESPTILLVAGIAGVIASTVLACKATLQLDKILTEQMEKKKFVEEQVKAGEETEEWAVEANKAIKLKTALEIGKKYAPSLGLGILSIGCLIEGHHILSVRNMALATSLETITKGWQTYRERVIEKSGVDYDKEIMSGIRKKSETVVNEEGVEETKIVEEQYGDPLYPFMYMFDSASCHYESNPHFSETYVRNVLNAARRKLDLQGYITLAEILRSLDIPVDEKAFTAGWVKDSKFGWINDAGFEESDQSIESWRLGYGGDGVWLQFNCAPDITSIMFPKKKVGSRAV